MELEWMDRGDCVDSDLNFFPQRGESIREQVAVCMGCIVREQCLEFGLTQKHGIWGGTSEKQRRRIRAQRTREAIDEP